MPLRTRAFSKAPAAVLPAGKPALPAVRRVQQAGRVAVPRQVRRAAQRQAPVADLRVAPTTVQQALVAGRPEVLPVRQAVPRRRRRDKLAAAQPVPWDRMRRAEPMAAVPRRVEQAPAPAARRRAPKRRSSVMTVNRAAVRKRMPPVRRVRTAPQAQLPVSRGQAGMPLKVRQARARARIPLRDPLRAVRSAMPMAASRPRCPSGCPVLLAVPREPIPEEAQVPRQICREAGVKPAVQLRVARWVVVQPAAVR